MADHSVPQSSWTWLRNWWPAVLVVVAFTIYTAAALLHWPPFSVATDAGLLGDSFGALTALFSGLAFAGLITQIHLQGKELELQRLELAQQRGEVKRLADEQARAASSMELQAQLNAMAAFIQAEAFSKRLSSADPSQEFRLAYEVLRKHVLQATAVAPDTTPPR